MDQDKDVKRNRPAEDGRRNDPDLRDESAIQPGVQTISSSETDDHNANITKTSADNFRPEEESDKFADPDFDDVDRTDGD
jgi:hypothetical protein